MWLADFSVDAAFLSSIGHASRHKSSCHSFRRGCCSYEADWHFCFESGLRRLHLLFNCVQHSCAEIATRLAQSKTKSTSVIGCDVAVGPSGRGVRNTNHDKSRTYMNTENASELTALCATRQRPRVESSHCRLRLRCAWEEGAPWVCAVCEPYGKYTSTPCTYALLRPRTHDTCGCVQVQLYSCELL